MNKIVCAIFAALVTFNASALVIESEVNLKDIDKLKEVYVASANVPHIALEEKVKGFFYYNDLGSKQRVQESDIRAYNAVSEFGERTYSYRVKLPADISTYFIDTYSNKEIKVVYEKYIRTDYKQGKTKTRVVVYENPTFFDKLNFYFMIFIYKIFGV